MFAQAGCFPYEASKSRVMSTYPNRPTPTPRQVMPSHRPRPVIVEQNTNWLLFGALGVIAAGALAVVMWRLDVQKQGEETGKKLVALLASADQLIQENRDDEAAAAANKAMELIPGDLRAQAVIDRINAKRDLVHKKKSTEAGFSMMRAEQLEKENLAAAVEAYDAIRMDAATTAEAKQAAADRAKAIRAGICTLILPEDWPADAELTIDELSKNTAKKRIDGIVHGKRTIGITRLQYRDPVPMEIEFRTSEPVRLPAFEWKVKGAKVFLTSTPAGAAVWKNGENTGKITPCEFEDVDEGTVEYVLKRPGYPDTIVKGKVEGRIPLKISGKLERR